MKKKDIKYLLRDIEHVRFELARIEMQLPIEYKHMWGYIYDYIGITESNLEKELNKK